MKIYTASKLNHSQRWVDLPLAYPDARIEVTARWPLKPHVKDAADPYSEGNEPMFNDAALMRRCWMEDEEDVRAADFVLVYGEPGENLRGALVEAGMALSLGKHVVCVGENDNFGTWHHHLLCRRFSTMDEAIRWMDQASRFSVAAADAEAAS